MSYSIYQEILEDCENMDSVRRDKLLQIYLHIPSLPRLRAIQASLVELKRTSRFRNGTQVRFSKPSTTETKPLAPRAESSTHDVL